MYKKRLFCFLLVLLIVSGCQKKVILDHEEIMRGNFSSIEGEYINFEGQIITIDAEDFSERLVGDVEYVNEQYYYMTLLADDGMLRIGFEIYPIGVEVVTWDDEGTIVLETDTSKIRVRYAQAEPLSGKDFYTKK